MKKLGLASVAVLSMVLGTLTGATPAIAAPDPAQAAVQILVKFRDGGAAAGVLRQHGLGEGSDVGGTGARAITVPAGKEAQLIQALAQNPAVEYAERDEVVVAFTNDTFFGRQYALQNDAQPFTNNYGTLTPTTPSRIDVPAGTKDADVDAVEAWALAQDASIKVAVLDSGVDGNHEDISSKVVARANFSSSATQPGEVVAEDHYGHGTHMTGTVAATADNGLGVAGVCPKCSILAGKVLNDSGVGSSSTLANGINWAVANGAKVINMSLGVRASRTLETAVNNAWNKGVVLVAAAGNGGNQAQIYPAGYPNVIAVGATDNSDKKASFSTYGASWVDIAAPGVNVFSTFPNHPFALETQNNRSRSYDVGNGTSVSSAIVSAVAALVWSKYPTSSAGIIRSKVESSGDWKTEMATYWKNGRVNAAKAVQ